MNSHLLRASRFISYALRHGPIDAGIVLDPEGWGSVTQLLKSLQSHGHHIDAATLAMIVADDEKGRFTISDDRRMIRANHGHSVPIVLAMATVPPIMLFHGTARTNLDSIRHVGLLRQSRQFVHLSETTPMAFSVGRRYGAPVVIPIDAGAMHADGLPFHHSASEIWLTKAVPPQYLDFAGLIFSEPHESDASHPQ
jgi:putative RNA 2'-phosphotransferase